MKKYLLGIALFAIISISTVHVKLTFQKNSLSTVFLENVEALANNESWISVMTCYYYISAHSTGPYETTTYCGDCKPILCSYWAVELSCVR